MAKRGLGRGLGSLIPSLNTDQQELEEVQVADVKPSESQPREQFGDQALAELADSIKRHGVLQPIVVRPAVGGGYELIAGERRWRAARETGLKTIPAVIKGSTDSEALQLALVENIQREDLNALEEARAFKRLMDDFEVTQADLGEMVGKNRTTVANTLRLLNLAEEVQEMVLNDNLSAGHARALLSLPDPEDQLKLAQRVLAEGLSVRRTEELVRLGALSNSAAGSRKLPVPPEVKSLARRLARSLGVRVRTKLTRDKLRLELELRDAGDLERLEEALAALARDSGRTPTP